ncbi:unnamed protein product, partial [Protopolystoma xenopodis]
MLPLKPALVLLFNPPLCLRFLLTLVVMTTLAHRPDLSSRDGLEAPLDGPRRVTPQKLNHSLYHLLGRHSEASQRLNDFFRNKEAVEVVRYLRARTGNRSGRLETRREKREFAIDHQNDFLDPETPLEFIVETLPPLTVHFLPNRWFYIRICVKPLLPSHHDVSEDLGPETKACHHLHTRGHRDYIEHGDTRFSWPATQFHLDQQIVVYVNRQPLLAYQPRSRHLSTIETRDIAYQNMLAWTHFTNRSVLLALRLSMQLHGADIVVRVECTSRSSKPSHQWLPLPAKSVAPMPTPTSTSTPASTSTSTSTSTPSEAATSLGDGVLVQHNYRRRLRMRRPTRTTVLEFTAYLQGEEIDATLLINLTEPIAVYHPAEVRQHSHAGLEVGSSKRPESAEETEEAEEVEETEEAAEPEDVEQTLEWRPHWSSASTAREVGEEARELEALRWMEAHHKISHIPAAFWSVGVEMGTKHAFHMVHHLTRRGPLLSQAERLQRKRSQARVAPKPARPTVNRDSRQHLEWLALQHGLNKLTSDDVRIFTDAGRRDLARRPDDPLQLTKWGGLSSRHVCDIFEADLPDPVSATLALEASVDRALEHENLTLPWTYPRNPFDLETWSLLHRRQHLQQSLEPAEASIVHYLAVGDAVRVTCEGHAEGSRLHVVYDSLYWHETARHEQTWDAPHAMTTIHLTLQAVLPTRLGLHSNSDRLDALEINSPDEITYLACGLPPNPGQVDSEAATPLIQSAVVRRIFLAI